MMRSAVGERQTVNAADLRAFEGLVHSTARMFASQVKREEDDLAQELRIIVWRAIRKHSTKRSALSLERFVFGCITNKIRDYKRDAAREVGRLERHGLSFLHIEDMHLPSDDPHRSAQEVFEGRYHFIDRDEIYGPIEDGGFKVPSTVTETEAHVLLLLMMEMTKPEVALRLRMTRLQVDACVRSLREKFADWRPSATRVATIAATLDAVAA